MKKFLLITSAILFSIGIFAQAVTTDKKTTITTTTVATTTPVTKYCCGKCDHSSFKAGHCPHDHTALVKEGMYYCPMHTDVTSDKAGNCPKCGMAMKKMDMETATKFCCDKCGYSSPEKGQCTHSTTEVMKDGSVMCAMCHDKAGKCPKCGTEMKKVEIREKKKG